MDKHLGIAVENFESSAHEKLLKQGMLCELIFCNSIANEKQSTSCADMFLEQTENGTFPMSNWTSGAAQGQGLGIHGVVGSPIPIATNNNAASRAASAHHLLSVHGAEDGNNESDLAAEALKFLYHLRKCVIHSARRLLTRHYNLLDRETYTSLSRPWKTIAWHALSPFFPTLSPAMHMHTSYGHGSGGPSSLQPQQSSSTINDYHGSPVLSSAPTPTKNSSHHNNLRAMKSPHKEALKAVRAQELEVLQAGPGAAVVVRNMFTELRSSHIATEVTLSLATNLRFASNSLKNDGVVLESSDLFVRLLRAAEVWLELFEAFGHAHTECEVSFHFLRVLLPSLGNTSITFSLRTIFYSHLIPDFLSFPLINY